MNTFLKSFSCWKHKPVALAITLIWAVTVSVASGSTIVASYEPAETDLTVTPGGGDPGLTCTIVEAASEGIAAPDGDYVLKLDIVGEDGKVEFAHNWSSSTYDLAWNNELLADIYIKTSSSIPSLVGIWSGNWSPPGAWQSAVGIPIEVNKWTTISFDVSGRWQSWLNSIGAFVIEGMPGADGTIYIDNLRVTNSSPGNVTATAHDQRVDLRWDQAGPNCEGYNIYRSQNYNGPYTKLNATPYTLMCVDRYIYSDFVGVNNATYYYYVTTVHNGQESVASDKVNATTYWMTDDQLLTSIQEAFFRYSWDFSHPVSGLVREGYWHGYDVCTSGGTGMGLLNIIVGVERGFITRTEGAVRVHQILKFLDDKSIRYHGAWSHWINGTSGATIPFGAQDDGADIVETAFLVQGMLAVREYFDGDNDLEFGIRVLATKMWEGVDWNWFRRPQQLDYLTWHWSPNYDWSLNMGIFGYNEAMITYLLAIASPTNPIPASCYYNGWASSPSYYNGSSHYGVWRCTGPDLGGPMFWTHYSFLGFDPRNRSDGICNYYDNCQSIALVDREYCIHNPLNHQGYGSLSWGLTASSGPFGYDAFEPYNDDGTLAPTAPISSIPFTPYESMLTIRHYYNTHGANLWGPFGFRDSFNLDENWYSDTYIAIDQTPMAVMIENHRTQACWNAFMANPEIEPMLLDIGWTITRGALDPVNPGTVVAGLEYEYYEDTNQEWVQLPYFDALEPIAEGTVSNFDISVRQQDDCFGLRFSGYLDIASNGEYTFYTDSDDGSRLYINDVLVVDNDGLHGMDGDRPGTIELNAGLHEIKVLFFERYSGQGLIVKYEGPGVAKTDIPNNVLYRKQ